MLLDETPASVSAAKSLPTGAVRCAYCGHACGPWARRGFLRWRTGHRPAWPP
jgi:hypothetical protein